MAIKEVVSVYDIQPYFDSYMMDVERNLELDPVELARYEKDPAPFMLDVLNDFHEGEWNEQEIREAVYRHLGVIK